MNQSIGEFVEAFNDNLDHEIKSRCPRVPSESCGLYKIIVVPLVEPGERQLMDISTGMICELKAGGSCFLDNPETKAAVLDSVSRKTIEQIDPDELYIP